MDLLGGTYDGTTIRSYKNNEVGSTSTSVSGDLVADTENALIASTQRTNEDARPEYKGKIALIQIYNRALTAAEVLQNYDAMRYRFNL